jgi:hypothetical protein
LQKSGPQLRLCAKQELTVLVSARQQSQPRTLLQGRGTGQDARHGHSGLQRGWQRAEERQRLPTRGRTQSAADSASDTIQRGCPPTHLMSVQASVLPTE